VSPSWPCRYGRRSWTLFGERTDWRQCREALASIAGVASDVIDRMQAEFRKEDLYAAFSAFDLQAWARALGEGEAQAMREVTGATRALCAGLATPHDPHAWRIAAAAALRCQGRTSTPLGNRMAWRRALDEGGVPGALDTVVRFYLAAWDGTGAVERGLGSDAALAQHHMGAAGAADLYSALTELKLEGPQCEEAMFSKVDGVLCFTDFSRRVAALWVARFGRRFTCSAKERKDKGTKAASPAQGTDVAVQKRARQAYDALCKAAAEDELASASTPGCPLSRPTVLGVHRTKLMRAVGGVDAPPPGTITEKYRAGTQRKLVEKRAHPLWSGTALGPPAARLGGSLAVIAESRGASELGHRATLWLNRAQRARAVSGTGQPGALATTTAPKPAVGAADGAAEAVATQLGATTPGPRRPLIADSLDELFRQRVVDPPTSDLLVWLRAVAHGGSVTTTRETFNFNAALKLRCSVHVADEFSRKHPPLRNALQEIVSLRQCQWRLGSAGGASTPSYRIERKRDFLEFLLRVRRLSVVRR